MMNTIKFKTNIKCGACIDKVTPALDQVAGKGNWSVDLTDPNRTLTITEGDPTTIHDRLQEVGYRADKI